MDSQWIDVEDMEFSAEYLRDPGLPVWICTQTINDPWCVPEFGLWDNDRWPEPSLKGESQWITNG